MAKHLSKKKKKKKVAIVDFPYVLVNANILILLGRIFAAKSNSDNILFLDCNKKESPWLSKGTPGKTTTISASLRSIVSKCLRTVFKWPCFSNKGSSSSESKLCCNFTRFSQQENRKLSTKPKFIKDNQTIWETSGSTQSCNEFDLGSRDSCYLKLFLVSLIIPWFHILVYGPIPKNA